ncbi:MAG: hypothetical protein EPO06_09395 [Burkholderiaceae bacterium]|nr:MAG: hypothetical protein EPO06_09395 [Burkholderiaceae bacterium]
MTTRGYEHELDRYRGTHEIDLVREWGTPVRVHTVGESRFLTFHRAEQVLIPAPPLLDAPIYTRRGLVYPWFYPPDQVVQRWCNTTFELQNDEVVGWQHDGNDCLARDRH